jgi:hypothetical protein
MSSGTIVTRVLIALCTFLLAGRGAGAFGDDPHGEWTVERLVALLKDQREPFLSFEEATYSSLLTEPLMTRGVLRFSPPATMEKEVMEPYRERYVIDGDQVLFESARKGIKKTLSLEDYPALRSFVEAFRASFTGDATQLKTVYETTIEGDRRKWTLLLRPQEPAGKSVIDSILFSGAEGRVDTIVVRAPDGDRSVMTLRRGRSR